jgi:hypothetical protein
MQMITETNAPEAMSQASAGVPMSDAPELKAELQWCIDNGTYGPRTGAALRWALEALDAMEAEATP